MVLEITEQERTILLARLKSLPINGTAQYADEIINTAFAVKNFINKVEALEEEVEDDKYSTK